MEDCLLELKNIGKSFFGVKALDRVSFSVHKGRMLGLIGENGAGKSTLMNIIGGVLQPDQGELYFREKNFICKNPKEAAKAGIAFIHQELNLFNNLSIAENIFINNFPKSSFSSLINRQKMKKRAQELMDRLNLDISPDTLVEKLTPGEKQLVEIAKALSYDADLIIFDEPTTSLTEKETRRLFKIIKKLKNEGKSIIFISHILEYIKEMCDDIVILRDGILVDEDVNENFSIDKMISGMVGREIGSMYPDKTSEPTENESLRVEKISQSGIVHNINFNLFKGELLGVFGLMGSGRSELARIIFGLDPYQNGKIFVQGEELTRRNPRERISKKMAFVTEDRFNEGLLMNVPILDNLSLVSLEKYCKTKFSIVDKSKLYKDECRIKESMKIKARNIEDAFPKFLSGGNQQKVVIGKWLLSQPSVFLLDEPTRGIDVGAKYEIYKIIDKLAAEGTGVLFISSEIEELMGMCDRILVMGNGEIQGEFERSEFDKEKIMRVAFRQTN